MKVYHCACSASVLQTNVVDHAQLLHPEAMQYLLQDLEECFRVSFAQSHSAALHMHVFSQSSKATFHEHEGIHLC